MRYRTLGKTGLSVSEVGHGTWAMGKQLWRGIDDAQSLRALHKSADRGVNLVDTALAYGNGHSERLIGTFLRERAERIFIATKVPPLNRSWPAYGKASEAFPAHHIRESAAASRQNLGLDRIDLLQLHVWHPDWLETAEWHDALCQLQTEGQIAYFGVSLNDHDPNSGLDLVDSGRVDTLQVIYNIFDQSAEDELFSRCQKHQVGVLARVPFDEGALTGNVDPDTEFSRKDWRRLYFRGQRKEALWKRVQGLQSLLGDEDVSLPQLALQFCLHHEAVSTVLTGMTKQEHVEENLAVMDLPVLSSKRLDELRRHSWEKNYYQFAEA